MTLQIESCSFKLKICSPFAFKYMYNCLSLCDLDILFNQDVVMLNKKLTKQRESAAPSNRRSAALPKGLKVMSKENHDRLESYQHLFYLLQTNPTYMAKLIFEMPQDRTTKFMESVIYSVFNYGSNVREEYLLAKLFKKALEEEIR